MNCVMILLVKKKKIYKHIKRIYVRSQYKFITSQYKNYFLQFYEDTFFANKSSNAGRLAHIKRNEEMIDESDFCIFYYDKNNFIKYKRNSTIKNLHSGTHFAFNYAISKKKRIINIFDSTGF